MNKIKCKTLTNKRLRYFQYKKILFLPLLYLLLLPSLSATPFNTTFLTADYWNDGKSEFNLYQAQENRYGTPRKAQVIHIFVKEPFAAALNVKTNSQKETETRPVIKFNHILHIPTGIYLYQQMLSAFIEQKTSHLLKLSLTSNDSCGNTYKRLQLHPKKPKHWTSQAFTYWENMEEQTQPFTLPQEALFYDALPLRLRSLNFASLDGKKISFPLAPSIISSKNTPIHFPKATLQIHKENNTYKTKLTHPQGIDTFTFQKKFPHLLLEWKKHDSSHLQLERSLKIDYWNYNDPKGKKRALQNTTQWKRK